MQIGRTFEFQRLHEIDHVACLLLYVVAIRYRTITLLFERNEK